MCFVLAIVGICFVAASGLAAENLVAFDRAKISAARTVCDLMVIAKLDQRAVALLKDGNLDRLKSIDNSATLVDPSTDIERLWVTGRDEDRPEPPGLLLSTQNYRLLNLSYAEAQDLMASGFRLSKCQRVDLPSDPPFFVPAKPRSRGSLITDIDSLMALVSVDSVRAYIQRLQDFQTRYTCTDSFWAATQWIYDKFVSWGYEDVAFQVFPTGWECNYSRNVIATKIGEVHPDRFLIMGGHCDAVVYDGGDPTVFAPGADDNGSGTAMAMEIARVLADTPFKQSVRFIAFGAEEQGLIGSWYYAVDALQRGEDIGLMINADMIGNVADPIMNFEIRCNEGGFVYGRVLEEIAEDYTYLIPEVYVGEFSGSDHYPFDQSGFRTVYSAESDFSPNWHDTTDIIDNIDVEYATEIVRSNLGMLLIALEAPAPITGLEAFNAGDGHTVYLQWDLSPDMEVIGYEVYLGTSEDGASIYDTSYVAADTVYGLDENTTYYFGIAGITADGGRSLIDEFVQLTTRSVPITPEALIVIPEAEQLRIQWVTTPELDFDYYQVYRRIGQEGDYQAYQQINDGEEFVDENVQSNIRYYYYVTQVDTTGLESDPSPEDYSKIISLDSGILFVDETRDFSGGQGNPTDEEQNLFYEFISEGYPITFHDVVDQGLLRINDLGAYSTLVWVDDDMIIQYLTDIDQHLADYMEAGGNLLFAGWRSFASYGTERPLYFEEGSFPFDYLSINSVNTTLSPDFSGATGAEGWPDLNVIPERVLPAWDGLLIAVDAMDLNEGPTPIYSYISASGDTLFDGRPVGIYIENTVYLTFPIYPMGDTAARELFITAMDIFGEQRTETVEIGGTNSLPSVFLSQNYPNPFNAETKIRFRIDENARIHLAVYNILGQKVEVLADGEYPAGNHFVTWSGGDLPSGVYFYRLMLDDGSVSRRMILLR